MRPVDRRAIFTVQDKNSGTNMSESGKITRENLVNFFSMTPENAAALLQRELGSSEFEGCEAARGVRSQIAGWDGYIPSNDVYLSSEDHASKLCSWILSPRAEPGSDAILAPASGGKLLGWRVLAALCVHPITQRGIKRHAVQIVQRCLNCAKKSCEPSAAMLDACSAALLRFPNVLRPSFAEAGDDDA